MDVMDRWAQFDPWRRHEGVRLMSVGDDYGLREDFVPPLIALTKEDLVLGRDERQVAKMTNEKLAMHMRVPREDVIGKRRTLIAHRVRQKDCQCRCADGRIEKPAPFVTYLTPTGKTYYYRLDDK